MSDELNREPQIPMICATGALKTGPVRIGHIAGDITLPRTVALPTLIAVGVGGAIGLIMALVARGGLQTGVLAVAFGGMLGYLITTYSPLRGESLLTWMGLQVNTFRKQRRVRGEPVVVAVGIAPVARETLGKFKMHRAAVRVPAGRFDDRGVVISVKNQNVPAGAHVFGNHVYVMGGEPPLTPTPAPVVDAGTAGPVAGPAQPTGSGAPQQAAMADAAVKPGRRGRRRAASPAADEPTMERPRRPERPERPGPAGPAGGPQSGPGHHGPGGVR